MQIARSLVFTCLLLFTAAGLYAQAEVAPFEGTIEYDVRFSGPLSENLKTNEANNRLQMHLKGGDYIVNLIGGRYPKTFMYVNEKDVEFSIDANQRTAYVYSSHTDLNRETKDVPTARFSGKTAEVDGLSCEVFRMKKDDNLFVFFVSDKYQVDLSQFEGKKRAKPFFLVEGLNGRIPLKILRKSEGLTVETKVAKITPREFAPEQFRLPEGFTIDKRDYRP
jgi:hypothetical protein